MRTRKNNTASVSVEISRAPAKVLADFNLDPSTESIALKKGKRIPSAAEIVSVVKLQAQQTQWSRVIGAQLIRQADRLGKISRPLIGEDGKPVENAGVISLESVNARDAVLDTLREAGKSNGDIRRMCDMVKVLDEKDRLVLAGKCDPHVTVDTIAVVIAATKQSLVAGKDGKGFELAVGEMKPLFDVLSANNGGATVNGVRDTLNACKIVANVNAVKDGKAEIPFSFNKGSDGHKANAKAVGLVKIDKGVTLETAERSALIPSKEDAAAALAVDPAKRTKLQAWQVENAPVDAAALALTQGEASAAQSAAAAENAEAKADIVDDTHGALWTEAFKVLDTLNRRFDALAKAGKDKYADAPNELDSELTKLAKSMHAGKVLTLKWEKPAAK